MLTFLTRLLYCRLPCCITTRGIHVKLDWILHHGILLLRHVLFRVPWLATSQCIVHATCLASHGPFSFQTLRGLMAMYPLGCLDMDRRVAVHGMDVTTRCEGVARTVLVN